MKKEAVQRDCSDHQASWADVLSMGWHAERGTVTCVLSALQQVAS